MKPISIEDYLEKSGDTEIVHGNKEENEHGFCIWRTSGDKLLLVQVYGDGHYWNKWSDKKARELGMKTILGYTKLNPKIFTQYGAKVVGYLMERTL